MRTRQREDRNGKEEDRAKEEGERKGGENGTQ
jgi:hypothetical protein